MEWYSIRPPDTPENPREPEDIMSHRKQIAFAVQFSRFCAAQAIDPTDAADLVTLAEKAFRAGERNCNEGTEASQLADQKAGERFEVKAQALGFNVTWPGLWPRLQRADGQDIYLPTVD